MVEQPGPSERPARRWVVITASAALVVGALALVLLRTTAPDEPVRIVYQVTGTAPLATVTYSTFEGEETLREDLASLPWRKEFAASELPLQGVLTVTIGDAGGDVACEVNVGGVERRSATATGAHTSALCDGFAEGP